MYLPNELPKAKVLITVKTYPLPSGKYEELVCTAGFLENRKWIRIYPVPFRSMPYGSQYKKYDWIELDLVRNAKDFRLESNRPARGSDEPIGSVGHIGTEREWSDRKSFALNEVFESMGDLIALAKGDQRKSLATLKPVEIVDLIIEEDEREWKKEWREQLRQYSLFDTGSEGEGRLRDVIRKLPFRYSYVFRTVGDKRTRKLMIEDWEIGALYWSCLAKANGDEVEANRLVKLKYLDSFVAEKDLYFFVGTTQQFHLKAPNPFVIIGVFYPPQSSGQMSLF